MEVTSGEPRRGSNHRRLLCAVGRELNRRTTGTIVRSRQHRRRKRVERQWDRGGDAVASSREARVDNTSTQRNTSARCRRRVWVHTGGRRRERRRSGSFATGHSSGRRLQLSLMSSTAAVAPARRHYSARLAPSGPAPISNSNQGRFTKSCVRSGKSPAFHPPA